MPRLDDTESWILNNALRGLREVVSVFREIKTEDRYEMMKKFREDIVLRSQRNLTGYEKERFDLAIELIDRRLKAWEEKDLI